MRTRSAAAATFVALMLCASLSACGPTADSTSGSDDDATTETDPGTSSGNDTGDDTADDSVDDTDDTSDSDDDFAGATLPGTGEYSVPDQAPIGGYELPDDQDGLPAGCTWQVFVENGEILGDSNGPFVFLTDVTTRFVTDGCPDWVQFE